MELIDGNVHLDESELDNLQMLAEDAFYDSEYSPDRLRWLLEQMRGEADAKFGGLMKRWDDEKQRTAIKPNITTQETMEFLAYKMAQLFAAEYLEKLEQVTRRMH